MFRPSLKDSQRLPALPEFFPLVSHFAATLLLGPFCLLIALWLASRVGRGEALLWCACVLGVGLGVALFKIGFGACRSHWGDIRSPSGHTAFAAIAYGGFTVIAMGRSLSLRAVLFRIAILAWVLLIGLSRVQLRAHSWGEVWCGLAIGLLGVAVFAGGYRSDLRPPYRLAGGLLIAVLIAAILLPSIQGFVLEPYLRQFARFLRPHVGWLCG